MKDIRLGAGKWPCSFLEDVWNLEVVLFETVSSSTGEMEKARGERYLFGKTLEPGPG